MFAIFISGVFIGLLTLMSSAQDVVDRRISIPNQIDGDIDTYWEYLISDQEVCNTPDVCSLFERGAYDSYLGYLLGKASISGVSPMTVGGLHESDFFDIFYASRRENAKWLKERITASGWFNISGYGEAADDLAFIIAQHSDHDLAFQKQALELMQAADAVGDTNPSNVALLTDRVAVASNQPQTYGSQGMCTATGTWTPNEIEDLESIDIRRAEKELEPISVYIARNSQGCP